MPAFAKSTDTLLGVITADAKIMTKETYPRLMEKLEKIFSIHGIKHPPTIYVAPYYPGASAFAEQNAIVTGEHYLVNHPLEKQVFLTTHETGHILAGHTGPSIKKSELMADRLGVQLQGSKTAAIAFRQDAAAAAHAEQLDPKQAGGWFKEKQYQLYNWLRNNRELRQYGSLEEQIHNIETTNLKDLDTLHSLVNKHNERFAR